MARLWRWFLPIIVLVIAVMVGRVYVHERWTGAGPLPQAADVVVPHGATDVVGAALHQAGVIRWVFAFRVAVALTTSEGPLHAGEFSFPAHGSLQAVLDILRHGRQVEHQLTIPEGLTAQEIAALINRAPALTGHIAPPPEGAILPNTYDYLWGTSRTTMLDRAEHALTATMDKVWPDRAPDLPLTTPAEAITLASIVERETAKPSERPMVAAVYINRLRAGMKLQADPTVIYAVSQGSGALDRPLDHADLQTASPYNTYLNPGLPPGPIAAPGIASIKAVLHPARTDALYFVADGTGGHVFSRDYAAQVKNVAKLRALENASSR